MHRRYPLFITFFRPEVDRFAIFDGHFIGIVSAQTVVEWQDIREGRIKVTRAKWNFIIDIPIAISILVLEGL